MNEQDSYLATHGHLAPRPNLLKVHVMGHCYQEQYCPDVPTATANYKENGKFKKNNHIKNMFFIFKISIGIILLTFSYLCRLAWLYTGGKGVSLSVPVG